MSEKKTKTLRNKSYIRWIRIAILVIALAVTVNIEINAYLNDVQKDNGIVADAKFEVHYLDVGQADCTVLLSDGEALLIDAGNNDDDQVILDYLTELHRQGKLETIKYAIGTHSHEDHDGALDAVMKEYPPRYVILPEEEATTRTYRDVLSVIEEKEIPVIRPVPGDTYSFGQASFQILGPIEGEKPSPNEYSVCVMVTYGRNRFLFTGDAEAAEEKEMLEKWNMPGALECDVFQAGHHGSSTSNSHAFLEAIDPTYTVISCGVDNKYGHPHAETLAEFEDQDIQVYRTDKMGTIVAVSDGTQVRMKTLNANIENQE